MKRDYRATAVDCISGVPAGLSAQPRVIVQIRVVAAFSERFFSSLEDGKSLLMANSVFGRFAKVCYIACVCTVGLR